MNLQKELNELVNTFNGGNFKEAERLSLAIAKLYPNNFIPWKALGLSLKNLKRFPEAVSPLKKAMELMPDDIETMMNLGIVFTEVAEYEDAENIYRRIIALKPADYPEAYLNLGVVLKYSGKNEEAEKCYRRAIEIKPDFVESYNNLAIILQDKGGYVEAEKYFRRAIELNPNYAEAYNNIGNLLKDTGRNKEAEIYYKLSLKINPKNYKVYNNLGLLCADSQRLDDAEMFYRKAIELNPNFAEAYNNLGNILRNKNQMPISVKAAETALDKSADASIAVAEFESEAEKYFRRAIELNPNYAEAYNNIGNLFNDTGRMEEAKEFYLKALSIKPNFALCHKNLAQIKTFDKSDPQIKTLQNLYENFKYNDNKYQDDHRAIYNNQNDNKYKKENNFSDRTKNISDKIYICFALAKANEDLNKIDAAFGLYSEGNILMKMKLNYNIAQDISLFEDIKSLFASCSKNTNIKALNIAPENIMPIMIVGMPRSGTSLVEQIISSHSKVFGGGELDLMDELVKKYYLESKEHCASGGAEELSRLIASDYFNEINKCGRIYRLTESCKKYFTDKMPLNFRWLGFILLFNPAVKIIHTVRNRDAVCWSIFKQLFSGTRMGFAYDLKDIYKYYGLYENIMEFWEEMFPSRIYRLDYERLTASQKEETQKLLDYCGLGWEDGCMEFEKNKRAVRTASFAQVRKKIYTGSSEEWKKFKSRIETALI